MIVTDASLIVDVLLRVPGAEALDARVFDSYESLHATLLTRDAQLSASSGHGARIELL